MTGNIQTGSESESDDTNGIPMAWLADLPFSRPGLEQQVDLFRGFLRHEGGLREVGACGIHQVMRALRDSRLRAHLRRLDLLVPNGSALRGLTWLAAARGARQRPGCPFSAMLHACRLEEAPLFLLGGPGGEVYDLARRLKSRLPGIRLAGAYSVSAGSDGSEAARRLLERIRKSGARALAIDPSHPFLERFARAVPARLPGTLSLTFWEGWPPRGRQGVGALPVQLTPRLIGLYGSALQRRFSTSREAVKAT